MKKGNIVMCVVALILGMLMANMLKSVCGCKSTVEGVNSKEFAQECTNFLCVARKNLGITGIDPPFTPRSKNPPDFIGGGWYGYGFEFGTIEYDNIPLRGNHDRDNEGTRMMRGWWPEFNWLEYPNSNDKK